MIQLACVSHKVIKVYLNLHKVSSFQIKEKKQKTVGLQKPEGLITRHLRHFAFSRVFFCSEGKSKTPKTSETELFVTLSNG